MFLVLVLTGVAWSLCFDAYRAWRSLVKPHGLVSDAGDLAFWLAGALLVAAGLFLGNWGELRLYVFLGLALGGTLYFRLASPVLLPWLRRLLRGGSLACLWLGRQTLRPVRAGWRGGRATWRGVRAVLRRGRLAVRRLLAWLGRLHGFL